MVPESALAWIADASANPALESCLKTAIVIHQVMVLESGILGLGFPELIVVAVAIVLLIEPKNIIYIKPIVKAAYKAWLNYKKDVEAAEKEMEDVKSSVMEPIISAKKEAESEALAERECGEKAGKKVPKARKKPPAPGKDEQQPKGAEGGAG
jgi:Sec-independent protein translocase protein TatA